MGKQHGYDVTDAISEELFEKVRARTLAFMEEAMREVQARMPWDQTLTLGPKQVEAKLHPFEYESGGVIIVDGSPQFSFDVGWDGGHIEFTVMVTGWGGGVSEDDVEDDTPKVLKVSFPGESMWVIPTGEHTGVLDSEPVSPLHDVRCGDEVRWEWREDGKAGWREFVEVVKRADPPLDDQK